MKTLALTAALLASASIASAHEFGFAGILDNTNKTELEEIELSVGKAMNDEVITLKSGGYYEIEITSDGSGEIQLHGPGFFRAIWINEVVINDLEVRPYGIESVEFDDEGTMEIEFLAIKPGQYFLGIPGGGDAQKVLINIQ